MTIIAGWNGPEQEQCTGCIRYYKQIGLETNQKMEDLKWDMESIKARLAEPKTLLIRVQGSEISGRIIGLGGPREVVQESGKWVVYPLDLAVSNGDLVMENGDLKLTRSGPGTDIGDEIKSIEDLAAWLECHA